MKVVVTADIHYGVGNNQHIVKNLAIAVPKLIKSLFGSFHLFLIAVF